MSEQLRSVVDKLTEKGLSSAIAGGLKIADDIIFENVAMYHKYMGVLRQVRAGILPFVAGVVGTLTGLEYFDESLAVGIANILKGAYDSLFAKKPFVYAKDSTHIVGYNLDANEDVTVVIDGSTISFTTPPKTDGYGNVEVTLTTELSAGRHEVILKTSKKAVYGIIVV